MSDKPMTVRKRPLEVVAMRWIPDFNDGELTKFISDGGGSIEFIASGCSHCEASSSSSPSIRTKEGPMRVSPGDWVIRGVHGEFYPCKPEIFVATYEPADATPSGNGGENG